MSETVIKIDNLVKEYKMFARKKDRLLEALFPSFIQRHGTFKAGMDVIRQKMEAVDAVLISGIPSDEKNMIQKAYVDQDKRLCFVPKISDSIVRYFAA